MTKKTLLATLALTLIVGLLLAACAPQPTETLTQPPQAEATEGPTETPEPSPTPEPTRAPIEISDGLGRTVILESPAQRVVSLAPSNTEILFAVGAGEQVVGRDDFTNYPPEAADLPTIGGSFGELNTEAIVALEPDLVLAAEIYTAEQVAALEDLGLTVFMLPNPLDLDGMYENLRVVARLTGHQREAETLIASLQERVAAVEAALEGVEERPSVFYELDSSDPNAPYTSGAGTFIDTLISMAGGQNIGAQFEQPWVQVSVEQLLAEDPDIILLGDAIWGVTPEDVAARAGWDALTAVQEGQIYPFDDDLVSRPGPRLVHGLEELAQIIHPEAFE